VTFKYLFVGAMPLALSACMPPPTPLPDTAYIAAPATVTVAARQTGYVNPIQNYTARLVVDPADWRGSNKSQAGL